MEDKIDKVIEAINSAESLAEQRVILREFAFRAFMGGQESVYDTGLSSKDLDEMTEKMHKTDPRNNDKKH
jgi:hypothetical protein